MRFLSLSIPSPCSQDYSAMTPTRRGAHCSACKKEVIDFTGWSDERVIAYFKHGGSACGKFREGQLKTYELPVKPSRFSTMARAALLLLLLLFLHRPAPAQKHRRDRTRTEQVIPDNQPQTAPLQFITVSGTVSDGGEGLPGVNVVRKGTSQGTVTDADGHFQIRMEDPNVHESLLFSFIGPVTQIEVDASKPESVVNFKLSNDKRANFKWANDTTSLGVPEPRRFSVGRLWWWLKGL